jgi:hypothetical protein
MKILQNKDLEKKYNKIRFTIREYCESIVVLKTTDAVYETVRDAVRTRTIRIQTLLKHNFVSHNVRTKFFFESV